MKKALLILSIALLSFYVFIGVVLFAFQERVIFHPQKLAKHVAFYFNQPFEEKNITLSDGIILSGLLFKSSHSKGLIFYLHGNAGSLHSWGDVASVYTDLGYDVFMIDYRGYGKSEGSITSQQQLFTDIQTAYDELCKMYDENTIVVLGYSIGTGPAAKLASTNAPKLLILQAPYYNLRDRMNKTFPFIPTFILKYKFETNEYLKACKMPVVISHGKSDEVIDYGSSLKLKAEFKKEDKLITLVGQGHNGMSENETYKKEIRQVLGQ